MHAAPTDRRRRVRGSAAVELLLSAPFLVLFCLLILDFARGYLSAQRGLAAARHLAWAHARHEEDPALPAGPDDAQLLEIHYEGRGGAVTHETGTDEEGIPFLSDIGEFLDDVLETFDFGRRFFGFITGNVDMTRGRVTQEVGGLFQMAQGSTMGQSHWVSLRSYREEDPGRRVGWWDPFVEISDAISGGFD